MVKGDGLSLSNLPNSLTRAGEEQPWFLFNCMLEVMLPENIDWRINGLTGLFAMVFMTAPFMGEQASVKFAQPVAGLERLHPPGVKSQPLSPLARKQI